MVKAVNADRLAWTCAAIAVKNTNAERGADEFIDKCMPNQSKGALAADEQARANEKARGWE